MSKEGIGVPIYLLAAIIIGILVLIIIVSALSAGYSGSISDIFSSFRAETGVEPKIRGALYQCELKCALMSQKYESTDGFKTSSFCTYTVKINDEPNHCWLDQLDDLLVYDCRAKLKDGGEVGVNKHCAGG